MIVLTNSIIVLTNSIIVLTNSVKVLTNFGWQVGDESTQMEVV